MARTKGTYSLPANVEVLAGAPLDARDRVATKADLTTSGTFPYPYVGMETFVVSEGKKYRLIGENPTVLDNWEELGSGILEGAKTVTGNPITLADGSDSYAEDLSVTIEPVQDLHGYSYPWVGGTGKNKLHVTMDSSTIGTFSMVVNSDGSVTFNGTAPSDIQNILADEYPTSNITIPSGTYKLNGGVAGVTILVYADNALIYMGSATSDAEFTIPSGISSSYVSISIASGSIFSNVTMYPMVRLSTVTDDTFVPYSNICPIQGYDIVNVGSVGKNLVEAIEAGIMDQTTGDNISGSGYRTKNHCHVLPSQPYTISGLNASAPFRVFYYDFYKNFLGSEALENVANYKVTFKTWKNAYYIRFQAGANIFDSTTPVQCELGTEATTYEPYQSQSVTLQFGQTVYSGTVDFTTGVLTVDMGFVTYDGSSDEEWMPSGSDKRVIIRDISSYIKKPSTGEELVGVISSQFVEVTSTNTYNGVPGISVDTGTGQVAVSNGSVMTVEGWKTYLNSNPLQVCYPLENSTTIQLTPQELKLLKQYNYISSNGITINLKYWPDTVLGDVLAASEAYTDRNKGEGGGAGAVKGYYKTADGKFYEESTYTTEITPDASLLYLDLSTEKIYDCDGTNYTLVTTDEKVTAETKNPTSGTWYNVSFLNETITNQKPYVNNGIRYATLEGTTTNSGYGRFVLGNATTTGTAGNKFGVLRVYSEKNGYADVTFSSASTTARDITLPDKSGTIALTSDVTDEKVTASAVNPSSETIYDFLSVPHSSQTTNQKPSVNSDTKVYIKEGTASAAGWVYFSAGNATSTGTAGNKYGALRLYSEKSGYVDLATTAASTSGRTIRFPDAAGTVALTSNLSSYLPLSGGTMTGALNFVNGTANKVGDDVQIGDYNKAGSLGVQGLNGNTSIKLIKNGASWASASEGGMILYNSTSKSLDFIFE